MNWVDFSIAASVFLIFFALTIVFLTNHFSNIIGGIKQTELRKIAFNYFKHILEKKGIPENWDKINETPVQIGLSNNLYLIPIVVKEDEYPRTNEIISMNINFEDCKKFIKNSSIRIFDGYYNEISYSITDQIFCQDNFLKSASVVFYDNITANTEKNYYLYYSSENITNPNYTKSFDLVGYWNFNEGSGSVANDSTENNNDGIISSATWTTGKYGNALLFDGGLVNVSDSNSLDVSQVTIEAWVNVNSLGTDKEIVQKNGAYGLKLGRSGGFNDRFVGYVWGLPSTQQPISNTISTGNWYHVVFTSNGTNHKLYLNGILQNSTVYANSIPSSNGALGIGGDSTGTNYINATIDEVRIYRRVLLDNEINAANNSAPITILTFPEIETFIISPDKFDSAKAIDASEVKKTLGEDYKFRIEVYKP